MSTAETPDASCVKGNTTNEKYTARERVRKQSMDLVATLSPFYLREVLLHSNINKHVEEPCCGSTLSTYLCVSVLFLCLRKVPSRPVFQQL